MSKASRLEKLSEMYAYYPHDRSHLEGSLLTFVETLGFDKGREKAVKDMVRASLNYFYQQCLIIEPEDTDFVRQVHEKALSKLRDDFEKQRGDIEE